MNVPFAPLTGKIDPNVLYAFVAKPRPFPLRWLGLLIQPIAPGLAGRLFWSVTNVEPVDR